MFMFPVDVRRMVNGDVLEFSALAYDTVRRLKQKVADQIKIPAHQQRLLLNTQILRVGPGGTRGRVENLAVIISEMGSTRSIEKCGPQVGTKIHDVFPQQTSIYSQPRLILEGNSITLPSLSHYYPDKTT
jgi:hypothetical protein